MKIPTPLMPKPRRKNHTAEASSSVMQLVERLLKAHREGSPSRALARHLEVAITQQQNDLLDDLARAIASYDGMEESTAMYAAVSRGDARAMAVNACYVARKTFAAMVISFKQPIDVLPGRPTRAQSCNSVVDRTDSDPLEVRPEETQGVQFETRGGKNGAGEVEEDEEEDDEPVVDLELDDFDV